MSKDSNSSDTTKPNKLKIFITRKHPLVVPVVTFLLLFFGTMVAMISFNSTTLGPTDSRVVNLYADGQELTVPTRARTVGDLLEARGIMLNQGDIVEPKATTEILEDNFSVNVYRARPVNVVDKGKEVTVLSAAQSPRGIVEDAGIDIEPEDEVTSSPPDQILDDGLITERLRIKRSIPIKLVLFGAAYDVRTLSKTVGELIEEKNITLSDVTVFPKSTTNLKPDTVVFVTSPGKKIVIREEKIPNGQETVEDDSLAAGTTRVRQAGRAGKKVVIYEIDKKDPSKRKVLQTVVAAKPVKRIIARGTKPTVTLTGGKAQWMAAAGISSADYSYVDFIIGHESGWNPGAVSPNRCIGLGQRCNPSILISACPSWQTDPVCQLKHFSGYASSRYGGWGGAYNAWQVQGWW